MQKTMKNRVRSTLDVESLSYGDFLARLHAVYGAMADKPSCLNSPVDVAGFKAAIDRHAAAVSAVVHGGKAAILERDKRRAEATDMLHSLADMLFEGDRSVDTNATLSPDQKP